MGYAIKMKEEYKKKEKKSVKWNKGTKHPTKLVD